MVKVVGKTKDVEEEEEEEERQRREGTVARVVKTLLWSEEIDPKTNTFKQIHCNNRYHVNKSQSIDFLHLLKCKLN